MNLDRVRKMNPVDRLVYWINERESIRLKKEAGEPKPWTDDPILRSFRFCNVRRMDDKVSRWLLDHWYLPNFDCPRMVGACALARWINLPESLAEIGFPKRWEPGRVKRVLRARADRSERVYNAAYMIRGGDDPRKEDTVVDRYVSPVFAKPPPVTGASMREAWAALVPYYGFGSFMAGQVVADLRWAMAGSWKDRMTWAPEGPGSRRGLLRALGKPLAAPMSHQGFADNFAWSMEKVRTDLPSSIAGRLEAMDYQNCLCEFDGYERVLWGQGRKKQGYLGV